MLRSLSVGALGLVALLASACSPSSSSPGTSNVSADTTADQPANFATVTTGIYRGGHPDPGGLLYLQSLGVTTIIDLEIGDLIEATPGEIDQELQGAAALGINEVREPISAFELGLSSSFDDKINAALAVLADPSQKPVYVHCAHGQDRTGLVIGLERVVNEGWAPSDAWAEMLAYGFHEGFLGLDGYFFRRTGWNPTDGSDSASADAGADTSAPTDTMSCDGVSDGTYCGSDGVNGDPSTLYQCSGGTASVTQVCDNGCTSNGGGSDACN